MSVICCVLVTLFESYSVYFFSIDIVKAFYASVKYFRVTVHSFRHFFLFPLANIFNSFITASKTLQVSNIRSSTRSRGVFLGSVISFIHYFKHLKSSQCSSPSSNTNITHTVKAMQTHVLIKHVHPPQVYLPISLPSPPSLAVVFLAPKSS